MAVLSVKERWHERQADDEKGTRAWLITTDSDADDPIAFIGALQAEGSLPFRGDGHPHNPFLTSRGISVDVYNSSPRHWIVKSEYKLPTNNDSERESQDRQDHPNPTERPPVINRSFEKIDRAISKDRDGKAIVNSAGEPFAEPIVVQETHPIWSITANVGEDPPWMDQFCDKVNSNAVTIRGRNYDVGQLLFDPGDVSEEHSEAGQTYFKVSFRLLVNRRGWKERRYDNGFRVRNDDDELVKVTTEDEDGNVTYPTDPVLLDGNGHELADPGPDTAVELEFETYETAPFEELPGVSAGS